ncbi:MAG TPA: hypothetical protein PK611_09930, partial [Saprospiraceae bacterium]|nr:hypothetical protein [Saprospiraceae bacterium]
KKSGFERITLKNKKLICFFISNPQSVYYETELFQKIIQYIGTIGQFKGITMKQNNTTLIMVRENVKTLQEVRTLLEEILQHADSTN